MAEKTKKFIKTTFYLSFLYGIFFVHMVFAQDSATDSGRGGGVIGRLDNPLKSINDLPSFVQQALRVIVQVAAPVVVLLIIWTGFQFVWAQGNKEKLETAKKSLGWTLVGAALLLGAWTLATIIQTTIKQLE